VFNLTRTQQYLLLGLAAVVVVAASYVYWQQAAARSRPAIIIEPATAGELQGDGDAAAAEPEPKVILVHVAGAVEKSGVYSLLEGSRVVDAVNAAGGATAEADLDATNLAQPLIDGQKVWVPKVGEQVGTTPAGEGVGASGSGEKVNINAAGLTELQTLPGIGPSLAKRIIDYRNNSGSFRQIEDITNVSGIGAKRFEQLKDYISVH
jgi:competence protein ComEA